MCLDTDLLFGHSTAVSIAGGKRRGKIRRNPRDDSRSPGKLWLPETRLKPHAIVLEPFFRESIGSITLDTYTQAENVNQVDPTGLSRPKLGVERVSWREDVLLLVAQKRQMKGVPCC